MRTTEEILTAIQAKQDSIFDYFIEVTVDYLPFDLAKKFLSPDFLQDANAEHRWENEIRRTSDAHVIEAMEHYMAFAWGKVLDHRGLSAGRSVSKMHAWLWLLGDPMADDIQNEVFGYAQYGAPVLAAVSNKYGFAIPDVEETARMIQGLPCTPECEDGCGV